MRLDYNLSSCVKQRRIDGNEIKKVGDENWLLLV
jgi:hypothetical protein